jgi:hypothetical protein
VLRLYADPPPPNRPPPLLRVDVCKKDNSVSEMLMLTAEFRNRSVSKVKGPLCLRNGIIFIFEILFIIWHFVAVSKNILTCGIQDLFIAYLALLAFGIIILINYFE